MTLKIIDILIKLDGAIWNFIQILATLTNGVDLTDADLYKSSQSTVWHKRPFSPLPPSPPFTYQSKVFSDLEDEKLWTRSWVTIGIYTPASKSW